ncbi:hypothetical protein QVD17_19293 [Tagetes erecta]|uniref:Glycine-rich protein n=1 Tax=Tagetes erecta TaxID=13708 RepID=A0AAD8KJB8_TARER|nr:hypothetical protein QVD17_19293 [Tagetes erecta]
MMIKSFILLCVLLGLVVLVSSIDEVETSKEERYVYIVVFIGTDTEHKGPEEYHVNQGYGDGRYGGPGGGYGGPGGGYGGPGGGYGWGGRGPGWGGRRGGGYQRGCRYGCCGQWYRYRGCSWCCRSLAEAIAFNENEATP